MLYRISVAERGLTGIANIFRSRLSRLDDLLRAGTVRYENCACRAPEKHVRSCGGARMWKTVSSRERLVRDTHQLLSEGWHVFTVFLPRAARRERGLRLIGCAGCHQLVVANGRDSVSRWAEVGHHQAHLCAVLGWSDRRVGALCAAAPSGPHLW